MMNTGHPQQTPQAPPSHFAQLNAIGLARGLAKSSTGSAGQILYRDSIRNVHCVFNIVQLLSVCGSGHVLNQWSFKKLQAFCHCHSGVNLSTLEISWNVLKYSLWSLK